MIVNEQWKTEISNWDQYLLWRARRGDCEADERVAVGGIQNSA